MKLFFDDIFLIETLDAENNTELLELINNYGYFEEFTDNDLELIKKAAEEAYWDNWDNVHKYIFEKGED